MLNVSVMPGFLIDKPPEYRPLMQASKESDLLTRQKSYLMSCPAKTCLLIVL